MKKIFIILITIFVGANLSAQSYEELVNKSFDFADAKDYTGAELTLKQAMRLEPDNPMNSALLLNLGTYQRNLGKLDEALISYNAALGRSPQATFLLHNRAALYCEMGSYDNALIDYSSILAKDPDDMEALYRRALIFTTRGGLLEAEADFNKILAKDPENLDAKSGLAMLLKRREQWEEAEIAYTYLLSKNKNNAELYFQRAEAYFQQKKLARTLEDLSKALSLGYDYPTLYILRGRVRLAQYDKYSAKQDFLKAQEMGAQEDIIEPLLKLCK